MIVHVGLIEALPFPDGTVEAVVSRLVLHYLLPALRRAGRAAMQRVVRTDVGGVGRSPWSFGTKTPAAG